MFVERKLQAAVILPSSVRVNNNNSSEGHVPKSEQLQSHRHLPVSLRNSVQFSTQQHQQTQHQQQQQQQQQQHNHPHRHEPAVVLCYCQPPPTINNCQTVSRGCALHPRLDQPVTNSTSSMDSKKIVQMSGPITTTAAPQQPQHQQVSQQPAAKTKESGTPSISGVRRRSAPTQGLRSPAAKRPVSAPVALQGWLHKQGSEGLMLWKKRWFVLSEYCLFYYKGPEEEKLLGSILLPSYRITVCRPEDKINKKFAFKAEHANMRTYHFAADTREAMNQWVNALTLASLLQDPNPGGGEIVLAGEGENGERSARPSVSSISSTMNQSADDSDSGFHGFQSRDEPSNNNSSPNSVNTGSFPGSSGNSNNNNGNNNDTQPQPMVNGWMQHHQQHQQPQPQQQQPYNPQQQPVFYPQRPRNYGQPVYANAPPKPRRMSDNPSPSPDGRLSSKSPLSMEYVDARTPNPVYGVQRLTSAQQQNLRTDKSGLNYGFAQPSERRTPDTYGRSSAKPNARRQVNGADYEDVYAAPPPQLYQRPAGPVGYTKGSAPTPITVPVYAQQQQQQQQPPPPPTAAAQVHPQYYVVTGPVTNAVTVMRQQQQPKSQQPPRPHSADFLEYEATRSPQTLTQPGNIPNQTRCPQRPKSSLDIINPSDVAVGDNYFYSEERYAAQMRQSAVYFHQAPPHLQQTQPSQQQHQQQLQQQQQLRNPSLSRATTPSKSSVSRDTESGIGTLSEMSCTSVRRSQREHPHQPHSLQRHTERTTASEAAHIRRSLRESRNPALIHGGGDQSPGRSLSRECQRRWPEQQQQQQQQQFARSASARLPRNRPIIDYDDDDDEDDDDYAEKSSGQDSRDGERKIQQREESMKRLLEWKQRMLQSPLTRKPTAGASSSSSSQRTSQQQQHNAELANCYKQQALLELAAHEAALAEQVHRHRRREDAHHRPHHPRSKSTDARRTGSSGVAALPRYNSYSSDDEELSDVRRKRTRRPTGRSPRSFEKEPLPAATLPPAGILKQRSDFEAHGYEEMSFPRPASKMEVKPTIQAQPKSTAPKKPSGILKTPGVYATNHPSTRNEAGRLSTLAGYIPRETWPVQKNVQWDSVKDDEQEEEEWEENIDESKVIKEFSYQYIKQEEPKDEPKTNDQVNLVQSRIRSFETSNPSPEKEATIMQEPLKVSLPQPAPEAYVSRIADSPRKATATVIREFALGDPKGSKTSSEEQKEELEDEIVKPSADRNKSVKDLLADFERKSQQVHRQEQEKQQQSKPAQRAVFSDTETLLYETGSDRDEDTRIVPKYKEQDKSQSNIDKSIEDSVNPAFARLSVAESLVTHGDRLSGDSDNASPTRTEDPNVEEHYLPMTPRKSILDPSADERPMPKMMESLFAGLREESSYVEMTQNGLTRSLLAPENSDYSTLENQHYEFVCVSDNKMEPVYMEVSQLADKEENSQALMRSTTANNNNNNNNEAAGEPPLLNSRGDLPDILTALKSDSSDADDESSKDLDSIDAPRHPRFSLSDTFRPASYYLGTSQTLIAELHDSSDSELVSPPPIPTSPPPLDDLDSLEMHDSLEIKKPDAQTRDSPKTWNKPAAQVEVRRSPLSFHDSRMSLDSSDSVELRSHDDQAVRQLKRRPVSDDMCEVLDSLDELESLGSRFDGASIDLDQYLEELQARDAFNVEMYAKDLSYNSIYGLNENLLNVADKLQKSAYAETNKAAGMVVNETTSSRTSLDQPYRYGSKSKTSSASSLPSMRVSEIPPTANHQHSQSFTGDAHYENISRFSPAIATTRSDIEIAHHHHEHGYRMPKSVSSPLANTVATHSRDSSYSFVSGTASVANYSAQRPASAQSSLVHSPVVATEQPTSTYIEQRTQQQQPQYHSRSASQDSARYSLSPNHRSSSSQDSSQYPVSTSAVARANPQSDQSGAPYYYSDLPAANTISIETRPEHHHQHARPIIAHTSRLPQLNNQRGDTAALNKRNDIGRMVNPIARQMPRQIQVDDIDEARKIAAELRKTTCQLLAEDKAGLVDRRNFYEADTLRRVKSTEPFVEPAPITPNDLAARNLYPHGLRDKSGSQTQLQSDNASGGEFASTATTSHRRSRSLEGLLDDAGLQTLVEQRNRANRQQAVVAAQQARPQQEPPIVNSEPAANATNESNNAFGGEDPWEQDSLWRESLRRVSLRHARSLDNLDSPSSSPRTTPTTESCRARTKITRGVTYVNDSVANSAERPRVKRRSDETTMSNGTIAPSDGNGKDGSAMRAQDNEDDAYESLAMDRIGAGGYIWDPENEAYRKPEHFLAEGNPAPAAAATAVAAATATSSNSFELDREKLRQWDLLSSACLLQEQPGRGLPATTAAAPPVASLATASSAAATGCASAVGASHRAKTMTTTQQQQQPPPPPQPLEAKLARASNGPGEWLYHCATTGAGLAYRK
ncbi:uncharacterized protein LOC131663141 isoform X3 [Phymastichus coffea]|uniref:uncharacterized protein LOC131663141 isoform X3 n=1 Tax=Phymastichus coffea TaxID=108790 RepID=UPI00273CA4E9|nr:uncharacterized protein LOC131663141 isoform X3 [Phymastichus coffea]